MAVVGIVSTAESTAEFVVAVSELMTSLKISSDYTCIQNKCTYS